MEKIELTHKENFDLIKFYNIEIGTVLIKENKEEIITNIHPLYGWIKTNKNDSSKVPQEVKKIITDGWVIKNYLDLFKCLTIQ